MRLFSVNAQAVFAVLFCLQYPAVSHAADDDTGLWTTTAASLKIAEQWHGKMLVQTRAVDDVSDHERTVLRPSISYTLNTYFRGTFGYDTHFIETPRDRLEQRLWQQWSAKWQSSPVGFSTRVRLEERFIEDVDETAYRLRLGVRATVPIADGGVIGILRNEYFTNLNDVDAGPASGFDQNRAFAGLGFPINDHASAEIGYQSQYINRGVGEDVVIHQLAVSVAFK